MEEVFKDYRGSEIRLSKIVWEKHIKSDHPRINKEIIKKVLRFPRLVCESQHESVKSQRQYYKGPWQSEKNKDRYYRVVVKNCKDGIWISTAHIRSKVSCGKILFRESVI